MLWIEANLAYHHIINIIIFPDPDFENTTLFEWYERKNYASAFLIFIQNRAMSLILEKLRGRQQIGKTTSLPLRRKVGYPKFSKMR